jgi:hypothetical protein
VRRARGVVEERLSQPHGERSRSRRADRDPPPVEAPALHSPVFSRFASANQRPLRAASLQVVTRKITIRLKRVPSIWTP